MTAPDASARHSLRSNQSAFNVTTLLRLVLIGTLAFPAIAGARAEVADATETTLDMPDDASNAENASPEMQIAEPDESLIDWDTLNIRDPWLQSPMRQLKSSPRPSPSSSWSRNDRSNGSSGVTVQQSLFPAWNANAGVDMDVARLSAPVTSSATLPDRLQSDRQLLNSSAAAWMTAKVSGVSFLWDQTSLEARTNPVQETRFGTAMSKSLPIWGDQFLLTLRHSYFVTQHGSLTGLGNASEYGLDLDRSARLKVTDTGMTLLAGQGRSTVDNRWLNRIGAEQQLFGGLSITGSINQTLDGGSSKTISAGFRHRW